MSNKSSLEKALEMFMVFTEEPYHLTVRDVAEKTGMNRTTVYRNLTTLENAGLLIRNEDNKKYSLGPLTYRMGSLYLSNASYEESVLDILGKIGAETKESVGIARREGDKIISIYSVERHQAVKMKDLPGTFYPINKGTYGKCLMAYRDPPVTREMLEKMTFEKITPNTLTTPDEILAEYEKIRQQGYVISMEETYNHITGVGVPLRGSDGKIRNVVAVSFIMQEGHMDKIEQIKQVLFKYKEELEVFIR